MGLIKVRDNKNRPINNLDVMMGALFGDKVPREFVVDKYYRTGDRVYDFDRDGNLNVWICNMSGRFKKCREPNFSEWSLNSIIEQNKRPTIVPGEPISPVMYDCKSGVSNRDTYAEYDGYAHFSTVVEGFSLKDYTGKHDIVDIYLRREHSDHYLRKEDYEFDGSRLSVALPLSDMVDERTYKTSFFPLGNVVEDTETVKYWYSEDGVNKTYPYGESNGIQVTNFDVLATVGRSIEYGYKVHDIKVTAVHTIVASQNRGRVRETVYHFDTIDIPSHARIGNAAVGTHQSVDITVNIEPDRGVVDTLTLSYDSNTQLISMRSQNGHIHQVQFSVVARKDKPLSVFMIGSKAISPMTRFIRTTDEYGTIVEKDGEHLVRIPRYELLKHNSFDFELYVNRIFRSDYEEVLDEESGELYIRMLNTDGFDWKTDTFLFHIFYCISQDGAIVKTSDSKKVTSEKDAFRIMLTTQFINKFQWLKMREDSKLIPPEYTVGSKSSANITNEQHYLKVGQTIKADVFSLLFMDNIVRRLGSQTDLCNSESYPILEPTRNLTIPFMNYDPEYDDFLIFKSTGVLVSTSKWYLDNKEVLMYLHEDKLSSGDYIDFRLLDRDKTVRIDSLFLDVDVANKSVDTGVDLSNTAFFLLFTVSGEYISGSKYTVDGSTIRFKTAEEYDQPYEPHEGSRLELVVGVYKDEHCKTLYKMIQIEATDDGQREFYLDEDADYNPASDNLLIFRKDGMYIGERFYHTDETCGKIVIDKGSGIPLGSYIDILLIRNMAVKVLPKEEEIMS